MKAHAASHRLGASLSVAVVLAFGLSACGSSKLVHEGTSATQSSTQGQAYPSGMQNHFIEVCALLKHENSSAYYSKEECATIYAYTEKHTSHEAMEEYIRSYANKALIERRFTGTEAEVQKQSIEWGIELWVAHSMKAYEESSGSGASGTTTQEEDTTPSTTESSGSSPGASGTESTSGCMPGTGPGEPDPQCQPLPGSPDYQPPSGSG